MVGVDDRTLKESPAWNHMQKVVGSLVQERPGQALDVLPSVSTQVNTGRLLPEAAPSVYRDTRPVSKQLVPADAKNDVEWAQKFGTQFVPPKPQRKPGDEEEEPEEEEDIPDQGELPDIISQQQIFNTFGEGLTEIEAFRINVGLKRLLDTEPLAKVRFWGKIVGTKRDYYVCESKIDESRLPEIEEPEVEEQELIGKAPETIYEALNTYRARNAPAVTAEDAKGVNENRYYVATSDDLTKWVQLPDVLPAHIIAARAIHKLFSGDLDAAIDCHPPFPGRERHYLRAQISRISSTTTICPKNMWTTDEIEEEEEDEDGNPIPKKFEVKPYEEMPALNPQETPDEEDPESFGPVEAWFRGYRHDELLEPKQWVHIAPQLLDEGRVTKFHPEEEPEVPEDEIEEEGTAPEHVEWIHPFLCDVSNDAPLKLTGHSKETLPAWTMRKAYHNNSSTERSYLARSLLWPGAFCFAVCEDSKPGAETENVYIGNGVKNLSGSVFSPPLPPIPCVEFPVSAKLQKDCTRDDELEFEPAPPAPTMPGEDEEGEEDE